MSIHIEKFIKENDFQKITPAEFDIANKFFSDFPTKHYGISSDIFFVKLGSQIYFKRLPFTFQNEIILTVKNRHYKRTKDYQNKDKLLSLFTGVHLFLNDNEINQISDEALKRSEYKRIEHRHGDNRDDNKRIKTGTIAEKAIENFTNTKTTDFSAPSFNSKSFQVADNLELNVGVKGSDEYNVYCVIENPAPHNEIICTNIKRYDRQGAHICCRGYASKEDLNNPVFKTRNALTDNGLLAKSIIAETKIGFNPDSETLIPFYSNNEINFNQNNPKLYNARNIAFDKNIDFRNLSTDFITNFEEAIKGNDSTIIYVHMNSLGLQTLKQLPYFYEKPKTKEQKERIVAFESFAMKYGLGVVFYDRFHKNASKRQYAPKNDKYLFGLIYSNGYIQPLRKAIKEKIK